MANFGRGGKRGGNHRGGFRAGGGNKRFGGRDSRHATMHETICSKCGKRCEVPFRPTGEKPVYCRDCFAGNASSGPERFENHGRRDFTESLSPNIGNDEIKKQLEGVNVRLERLISAVQVLAEARVISKTISSKKKIAKKVTKKISAKK